MENPKVKVAAYVSGHGYGHTSRTIALLRHLLERGDCSFVVSSETTYDFLRRSLTHPRGIRLRQVTMDFGLVALEGRRAIDWRQTERALEQLLADWDLVVAQEQAFLAEQQVDWVLSDIVPQPLVAASTLGIPSVLVGNFTWIDYYLNAPIAIPTLSPLYDAYATLSACFDPGLCMALEGCSLTRVVEVGPIFRRPTRSRDQIRRQLGVPKGQPLVYIGAGGSILYDASWLSCSDDVRLVCMQGVRGVSGAHVPSEADVESQDYLAAADLVVAKPGYSTLAECIGLARPILMVDVVDHPEHPCLMKPMERVGLGRQVRLDEISEIISNADSVRAAAASLQVSGIERIPYGPQQIEEQLEKWGWLPPKGQGPSQLPLELMGMIHND